MWNLKKFNLPFFVFLIFWWPYIIGQQSSILFEINGNGLTKPSYLFGTIHMIPKSDFFLTDIMLEKFDSAEALVTEIPMDMSLKEQLKLAQRMILTEGKTYKDYMKPEEFHSFYQYLTDSLDIREKKVERYMKIKPIFLSGIIMQEILGKIKIYEMEFNRLAGKNDMTLLALETAEEQMDIVDSIPLEMQFKDLEKPSSYLSEYQTMIAAYKNQELNKLCRLLDEDVEFKKIEKVMLDNRNMKWVSKLTVMMKEQSCFVAVGAAHLCGDTGLINLLRESGYHVNPIF